MAAYLRRVREVVLAGQPVSLYGLHCEHESPARHQDQPHRERGGEMSKESWILILCVWILVCMSVVEIRNKEARAEVKAALELVKKANALCKEEK